MLQLWVLQAQVVDFVVLKHGATLTNLMELVVLHIVQLVQLQMELKEF